MKGVNPYFGQLWRKLKANKFNVALVGVGLTFLSFFGYHTYNQDNFNRPAVAESVQVLSKIPKITDLVGMPISYKYSLVSNKIVDLGNNETAYAFEISGPKASHIRIRMETHDLPANQVYQYGSKFSSIQQLETKMLEQNKLLQDLTKQIKCEKNSSKQKELIISQKAQEMKLENLKLQIEDQNYQIIEKKNKYYIPSKTQIYQKCLAGKKQDFNQVIDKDEKFTGIKKLFVNIGSNERNMIAVFSEIQDKQKKNNQKQNVLKNSPNIDTPTIGYIHQNFLKIDTSKFSDQELEAYGSQKTQFMYRKNMLYRITGTIFIFGFGVFYYQYSKTNVLKSLKNTVLEKQIKFTVKKNPKVMEVLKKKNMEDFVYEKMIYGGMRNNQFEGTLLIKSPKYGKIHFKGHYIPIQGDYKYQKLILMCKNNKDEELERIDLLN